MGSDNPIVHTIYGPVRGYTESGIKGRQYYAFKGIPYAKPPVGDLRFEVSSFPIRCGHSSVNRSIGLLELSPVYYFYLQKFKINYIETTNIANTI